MNFRLLASAAFAIVLFAGLPAAAEVQFRTPSLVPTHVIELDAPEEKSLAPQVDGLGRLRVGPVRVLEEAARLDAWAPVTGGYATRVRVTSSGAVGLRVRLELGNDARAMEVRAQGDGEVVTLAIDSSAGNEAWTPWTEGERQSIEIFSRSAPAEDAVRVSGLLHFSQSPLAKAAASCTLSTACSSGEAGLDAAIAERKKSVFKIQFIEGGSGFVCTATLIDTPRRPAAFALTANHCIGSSLTAATIEGWWFYEASACGSALQSASAVRVPGGAQLTFTNFNVDSTLLLLNQPPPAGALYAPLNAALLAPGQAVVSISHPRGDTSRWATGTAGAQARDHDRPYSMYLANWSRGIIEPGSSGSGLYTMNAGHLELRGVLSQASTELSCTSTTLPTLFARLEAFYPQMAQYIGAATVAVDDAPNRPQDLVGTALDLNGSDKPLNTRADTFGLDNRRIDYPGDVDVYRFNVTAASYVSVWTEGALDTVGSILDSNGAALESDDDGDWSVSSNNNFGITRKLQPGTYYVHVANWVPTGTGAYNLRMRADVVDANYTDLWSTAAESGWGLNINHQGNTLFATLYTYDASGAPVWLVMSKGDRQADGSYSGSLYRASGTPFSAAAWGAPTLTSVGTMRLTFTDLGSATLQYTVDGVAVAKSITRFTFGSAPTCTWTGFERGNARNYQDIWWMPSEPGWGASIAHQGGTIFVTLYVYGADGRGTWYVMSDGNKNINGAYVGSLYRATGPAFNASPWGAVTLSPVGSVTLTFASGNAASLAYTVNGVTVAKQIQRNVFGMPKTICET